MYAPYEKIAMNKNCSYRRGIKERIINLTIGGALVGESGVNFQELYSS